MVTIHKMKKRKKSEGGREGTKSALVGNDKMIMMHGSYIMAPLPITITSDSCLLVRSESEPSDVLLGSPSVSFRLVS